MALHRNQKYLQHEENGRIFIYSKVLAKRHDLRIYHPTEADYEGSEDTGENFQAGEVEPKPATLSLSAGQRDAIAATFGSLEVGAEQGVEKLTAIKGIGLVTARKVVEFYTE